MVRALSVVTSTGEVPYDEGRVKRSILEVNAHAPTPENASD